MKAFSRCINSRGESLIELLVALFIIGTTLTVVISAFMSGSSAVVSSWDSTDENMAASFIMEGLKATPYDTVKGWDHETWTEIQQTTISIDPKYSQYDIKFDLVPYSTYSIDDLLQINVVVSKGYEGMNPCMEEEVRVRDGEKTCLKKTSLITKR